MENSRCFWISLLENFSAQKFHENPFYMTISTFFTLILAISIFPFTVMNSERVSPKFLIFSGLLSLTIAWTSVIMILLLVARIVFLFFWG